MPRWIYVNGRYALPHEATVSFQDRGFQFGDGIYVVLAYYQGRFVDEKMHLDHLESYCRSIYLPMPMERGALQAVMKECVRLNRLQEGHVYIQVTRGSAKRVHWFPEDVIPTLVVVASPWKYELDAAKIKCVKVISAQDIRWRLPNVKTTSLLPTVLLRQLAKNHDAFESWLIDDKGFISEGASSNAYIINEKGVLVTRPEDGTLIPGVTRNRLLKLAQNHGIAIEEKAFTPHEASHAAEAFLSGATSTIKAVTHFDDRPIANAMPGPITQKLAALYFDYFKHGD